MGEENNNENQRFSSTKKPMVFGAQKFRRNF